MCIIGNQKAQEAKNEVIHNHKQFTVWHLLLGLICVFSQLSIHFYVIKIIQLFILPSISKSQSYVYFDNQKYTTTTQSGRKKNVVLPFLATKISKTKMTTGLYINILAELWLKYYIPLMFN